MTLDEIGRLYGTDQSSTFHNYLNRFEPYFEPFRDKQINLLELGIWKGASIRTWHKYFEHASIYAVDMDPQTFVALPTSRVFPILGDTNSVDFWNTFPVLDFDIIIDDADHHANAQYFAFTKSFPRLKSGGVYIIQDTHFERYAGVARFFNTVALRMYAGPPDDCGDWEKSTAEIAFVHLSRSLIIVGKR